MKKEKTIRTYQRRTKSGKVVTVKQHTAKYDAAEELRKALSKKKGAGDEFEGRKGKQAVQLEFDFDKKQDKEDTLGFTADDFKAWYHWDQDSDPKNKSALKVEKALKKQMGTKAYNKYFDEMSDSYSARGHNKAFKNLESEHTERQKKQDAELSRAIASGAKESKKVGARYDKAIKRYMDKMPKSMTIDEAIKYHEKSMPTYDEFGHDTAFTERDKRMLRDYLSGKLDINVESHLSQLKERVGAKSKEGGSSRESSTKAKPSSKRPTKVDTTSLRDSEGKVEKGKNLFIGSNGEAHIKVGRGKTSKK